MKLWSERGRAQLQTMLAKSPAQFQGLRKSYTTREIKDVSTLELGEYVLHYYKRQSEPSAMKTIMLRSSQDGYELADDLHVNVRRFVESRRVKSALDKMWSDQEER